MSKSKPWERSFLEKIHDFFFFEMNIFRTIAVIWMLFWVSALVGGVFVAVHFIHKYW